MAADVIMLNLWAHDVERADGQAYSVLRSVLEEAVRLLEEGLNGNVDEVGAARRGHDLSSAAEAARFPKVREVYEKSRRGREAGECLRWVAAGRSVSFSRPS